MVGIYGQQHKKPFKLDPYGLAVQILRPGYQYQKILENNGLFVEFISRNYTPSLIFNF